MRPVSKGKNDKTYNPYSTARRDLYAAIGRYCSYCERTLTFSGAIEHVIPKSIDHGKEYCWDNFLLACINCNSRKGDKPVTETNISNFLWPDKDDTYHAIEYDSLTGIPFANPSESHPDKAKALIEFVGLNTHEAEEGTTDYAKCSDTRVPDRISCMQLAKKYAEYYKKANNDIQQAMLPLLQDLVKAKGFWSIWMHAFECEPTLKIMLLDLIPGTEKKYF